jgi:hypothetical protein
MDTDVLTGENGGNGEGDFIGVFWSLGFGFILVGSRCETATGDFGFGGDIGGGGHCCFGLAAGAGAGVSGEEVE